MEEMELRGAQQRQTQSEPWQGDRPMILPLLLREKKPEHFVKAAEGLLKMARLQNYFPSFLLVVLGAWMASGHDARVILMPKVWITAACSALIAVASMLANDVFDFRSGTDQANERDTPLMTGEVAPDDAELAAGCLYGAAVIGICCLEPMTLRLLVGGAAVATYIYTPFLKRLLVVKNVIVAAIIASSILAGGLVAGGAAGVARTGQVSLFFFLCILCREILMDVGDMVGDKAAGVRTVAVCFGRRVGTAAAGIALAAANAVLIGILAKTQAVAAAGTLLLLPLHARIFQLLQGGSDFTADRLSLLRGVVDQSMLYIGGSVLLLATIV
ncbi:hypothetical protein KFL_000710180 [Klebsormidium nitens]|uniref:Prenyltransferase n=1 Tax=Klebsormidium nitens TaxID=105231 RepID=A0A1Y1HSM7_KLENI|nr:hypothetical protein KFL_000710180 [Klebsormidium nitens]|eukprot:GAQ81113.1 hypothetical protein KFL_000710180 [Klebsormidium nitens]